MSGNLLHILSAKHEALFSPMWSLHPQSPLLGTQLGYNCEDRLKICVDYVSHEPPTACLPSIRGEEWEKAQEELEEETEQGEEGEEERGTLGKNVWNSFPVLSVWERARRRSHGRGQSERRDLDNVKGR